MILASCGSSSAAPLVKQLVAAGADPNLESNPDERRESKREELLDEWEAAGRDVSRMREWRHQPLKAVEMARANNRKIYEAFVEVLGRENVLQDAFELAQSALDSLSAFADEVWFKELAKSVASRLGVRSIRWRKRKGVLSFTAKLKDLPRVNGDEDEEILRLAPIQQLAAGNNATAVYSSLPMDARHEAKVLLFPTSDWAAVVRACGTNGHNHGLTNRDIVNRLAEIAEEHPFEVLGCGHDFVEIRFHEPIDSWRALHEEILQFCPDLSEDFEEDESELAAHYSEDRRVFFWWD
jgi:hypothetical protein